MKSYLVVLFTISIVQICYAPPVTKNKKENADSDEDSGVKGLEDYMEYHRYLKEVVNALESDPQFREKLEKAEEHEIKSGKIAEELEFVSHHVRTRLDEIKRIELERLKKLMEEKRKLEGDSNAIEDDPVHHHLDHSNKHTFEIEDLKKLIAKTTQDLAEADKKRREQFKEYELEKEYKKQVKLNHTNGEDRDKLEKEMKELEEKHKKHEKLHEPGHKAQLEEVWQEQDQMQQDFDPKTFFMLHDLDGNGLWDQDEVKSLFIKELDKMYQQGAPEDDMRERIEEMERMRETVFQEMDKNSDGFIDFNEFLHQTNTNEFKEDHGWQALDERRPFTDEELAEYIRQHEEANRIHPGQYQYPGEYQQQVPQGYQQQPSGAYHVPQGYQQQQVPPGGYHQVAPSEYHPGAVPQAQYQQGQVPQHPGQQVPGHVPQLQLNTNEVYPHQQQANQHPGQVNYQNQQANYAPPPNQQQAYHNQQQQQVYQQQAQQAHQQQQLLNQQAQQVHQQQQQVNQQAQQVHPQQVNQQLNQQPQQVNQQQQQLNQQPQQVNQPPQQINQQPQQVNQQPQQVNQQPQQVNQQPQQVNQQPQQINQQPQQVNQHPQQVPNVQSNQIPHT